MGGFMSNIFLERDLKAIDRLTELYTADAIVARYGSSWVHTECMSRSTVLKIQVWVISFDLQYKWSRWRLECTSQHDLYGRQWLCSSCFNTAGCELCLWSCVHVCFQTLCSSGNRSIVRISMHHWNKGVSLLQNYHNDMMYLNRCM